MADEAELREYVLNDTGIIWKGAHNNMVPSRWLYGQVRYIFKVNIHPVMRMTLRKSGLSTRSLGTKPKDTQPNTLQITNQGQCCPCGVWRVNLYSEGSETTPQYSPSTHDIWGTMVFFVIYTFIFYKRNYVLTTNMPPILNSETRHWF
jgi:hypothetical protein